MIMKKIFCLISVLLILGSCSVQEKVSPMIFMKRIIKTDNNLNADIDSSFVEDNNYICFAKYAEKTDVVFEIKTDEGGNVKKISLACTQADKTDDFIDCVSSVIKTYAPDDDIQSVLSSILLTKNTSDNFSYHETQWYLYSSAVTENGLYFSVENKKLIPQSEVEFSLKQNDIVEY